MHATNIELTIKRESSVFFIESGFVTSCKVTQKKRYCGWSVKKRGVVRMGGLVLGGGVKEDEKRDCAGAAKAIKWLKVRYEQKRKI